MKTEVASAASINAAGQRWHREHQQQRDCRRVPGERYPKKSFRRPFLKIVTIKLIPVSVEPNPPGTAHIQ